MKSQVAEWNSENANVSTESKKLDSLKKSLQEFDDACDRQKQELQRLQDYLAEHDADASLVNILPEMNGYAVEAANHHKESVRLQNEIESKKKLLENTRKEREDALAELATLQNDKESIIQEDIPVVVEELRRNLKDGEPCPVCGSLEHVSCKESAKIENGADRLNDFAAKLRKINSEMEKIQRMIDAFSTQQQNCEDVICEFIQKQQNEAESEQESLKLLNEKLVPWKKIATVESIRSILDELQSFKTNYLQKKENADALQGEVNQASVKRAKLESDVNVAEDSLKKSQERLQQLSQKIEDVFAKWFSNVRMEDADALLHELEKKNDYWKKAQEKKNKVENNLETYRSNKVQLLENLTQTQSRLNEAKVKCDELRNALTSLVANRKNVFGEKSVDEERNKARTLRDTAESEMNKAHRKEQQMREAETEPKLAQTQSLFFENLASKNFANAQEFMAAKLPEAERKSLQQLQKKVDDALTSAQAAIKSCSDQLADHQQKRNFEESEDAAKLNRDTAKAKLNECTVNLATWTEQKKNDDLLRQKFSDMQVELETLKAKRSDWEQMQRWFNGNRLETGNGDVFVKFIQTITLRNLLKIANGYLHDMFPRYEMVAEPNKLNIQLVDHDNSDAVRPIDNISGGEGFVVSLSLALGISTLASRNVRIDSMFLDEGFGTLDSKMLQETVVVLQKMQQEKGKLLGVITHVDLVKSELPTRIEVTPYGGRSVLSGAGVCR